MKVLLVITVLLVFVGAKRKTLLIETADNTSSKLNSTTSEGYSDDYGTDIDCLTQSR